MQHRPALLLLATSLLIVGCIATGPSEPISGSVPPTSTSSAAQSPSTQPDVATATPGASTPTAVPSPTIVQIEDLPALPPGTEAILAVCDPSPGLGFPDAGDDLLGCGDGIRMGLKALATVTRDAIARVYLDRPVCASAPCSEEQLATGVLTAWTEDSAWTTALDGRTDTATVPVVDSEPRWPTVEAPVPPVDRPAVDGAPEEVADRTALPFCGRAELGEPPSVDECFVAAVLSGRPAEMIETLYGTEGGTVHVVNRFMGSGAIVTYRNDVDAAGNGLPWHRQLSRLWLGVDAAHWTPDPIDGTDKKLR